MHKVYLGVMWFNERAMKTYEKCGFVKEGISRDDFYKNGKYHDVNYPPLKRRACN